jgi:hypothetical protein
VHRSSESFATLAAALAKAQAKLVNPEKSLTATIRGARPGERERTFRYAPLSSGLEIVRKTLSEHEIAVIQTTAVDQTAGVLNLTTLLAHSSGEWIASYWPICSIVELANPHRMGAALTYARRYALFTLVGIAGEDDLDAPDLCIVPPGTPATAGAGSAVGNGQPRAALKSGRTPVLAADTSAALRDRLLAEIVALQSHEGATTWARRALIAKNQLTAEDAKLLEEAFETRLSQLPLSDCPEALTGKASEPSNDAEQNVPAAEQANRANAPQEIDKSVLTLGIRRRYRNRNHLQYVTQQPCLLCGRKPSDAHHIRFVQPRALGRKASDEFTVPLCRFHHREVHRVGDEEAWWKKAGIDALKVARNLWKHTRIDEGRTKPDTTAQAAAALSSGHEGDAATSADHPVDAQQPV